MKKLVMDKILIKSSIPRNIDQSSIGFTDLEVENLINQILFMTNLPESQKKYKHLKTRIFETKRSSYYAIFVSQIFLDFNLNSISTFDLFF